MRLNAKQIAHFTGGTLVVNPVDLGQLATGLTWDSRQVTPGDVYVALPGERVDGHSFVDAALRAGAQIALVMQPMDEKTKLLAKELGAGIIEVSNTTAAITDLARAWRGFLQGKVIGLTGSSGKTTTKNLVRDVLSAGFSVVATQGNQNNELGVPKTLLNANPETQCVVVEMGMRGLHQIEPLCDLVKPDLGIIVNVGESHIELLGGRDNIARAKAELFQALPDGTGVAFVNAADDYASFVCQQGALKQRNVEAVSFGAYEGEPATKCAVFAQNIALDEQGRPCFTLRAYGFPAAYGEDQQVSVTLNLRGIHNASNASAAAAVGLSLGMSLQQVAEALATAEPESGRQQIIKARAGFTVVNDAYNANPESMRASLITFAAMETAGKRVAVLGDMGELGSYAPACHTGIGSLIPELPIDTLICIGELSAYIAQAARDAGMPQDKIMQAETVSDVLGMLDSLLMPQDAVLVKASHFMGLSRVVEGLIH